MKNCRILACYTAFLVCTFGVVHDADAAQHLIDINEVYSNASGTVQFVELITLQSFQSALASTSIIAYNADGSTTTTVFDFVATYPPFAGGGTIGLTVLLATAGFEAEFGIAPDFIIPDNSISLTDGRVVFFKETGSCAGIPPGVNNCEIDAVAYGNYSGPNVPFYGMPASPLPTSGCLSLTRTGSSNNNALGFEVMPATPRRTDGTEGTCPPPQGVDDFIRGDCNGDGNFNALSDIIFLLNFGFNGGVAPLCLEAADVDTPR